MIHMGHIQSTCVECVLMHVISPSVRLLFEPAALTVIRCNCRVLACALWWCRRGEDAGWAGSSESEEAGGSPLERVYLVGVQQKGSQGKYGYSIEQSLEELGRLADTAGLEARTRAQ